jgi:molybdopterin-guanine dinucleotide biosynthesis protein B
MNPPVFGVVGWKNSGKTTLMANLIKELTRRGFAISVIKHAHAKFEIDHPGRDSFKMREAGARQVTLSSPRRFALMRELGDAPEMPFASREPLSAECPQVVAIASDRPGSEEDRLPVFHIDDIACIVDFIAATLELKHP